MSFWIATEIKSRESRGEGNDTVQRIVHPPAGVPVARKRGTAFYFQRQAEKVGA